MAGPRLQRAKNGVWYIHWTEPGQRGQRGRSKRVSTGATSLDAAKSALAEWLTLEHKRDDVAASATVAELWAAYDTRHVEHVASPITLRQSWKNLEPHFGRLTVNQVTQQQVDAYVRLRIAGKIGRPSVPATCRRELTGLLSCFGWCAKPRQKIILPADVPLLELPPAGDPRDRWLTTDELKRLFDTAEALRQGERLSRGERFLWLGVETAARKQATSSS